MREFRRQTQSKTIAVKEQHVPSTFCFEITFRVLHPVCHLIKDAILHKLVNHKENMLMSLRPEGKS